MRIEQWPCWSNSLLSIRRLAICSFIASINQTNGWRSLCPSSEWNESSAVSQLIHLLSELNQENVSTVFLDNNQRANHHSLIFGVREMNRTEMQDFCLFNRTEGSEPPITDQPLHFTFNYRLGTSTACCYYLHSSYSWQTDGLIVSSMSRVQSCTRSFSVPGWTPDQSQSEELPIDRWEKTW